MDLDRRLFERAFLIACAVVGGVALYGEIAQVSGNGPVAWVSAGVGLALIGSAVAGLTGWHPQSASVFAMSIFVAAAAFHLGAIVEASKPACGCLRALGTRSHAWYLASLSAVCVLGFLSVAPTLSTRRLGEVVGLFLCAVLLGWFWPAADAAISVGLPHSENLAQQPGLASGTIVARDPTSEPPARSLPASGAPVRIEVSLPEGPASAEGTLTLLDESLTPVMEQAVGLLPGRSDWSVDGCVASVVALELPSRPVLSARLAWRNEEDVHVGRARLRWSAAPSARIVGTVLDGLGKPVPGFDVVLGSSPDAAWLRDRTARAKGALFTKRVTVVATTNDRGEFVAAGWTEPSVYVRVAKSGWAQLVPGDPRATVHAPGRAHPVTLSDPASDEQVGARPQITVGPMLVLAVRAHVLAPDGVRVDDPWLRLHLGLFEAPSSAVSLGFNTSGSARPPPPPGVRHIATLVSPDSEYLDDPAHTAQVIAVCPGYETAIVDVPWRRADQSEATQIVLRPRRAGHAADVSIKLSDSPPDLTAGLVHVRVRDLSPSSVAYSEPRTVLRGALIKDGQLRFARPFPPGDYEVDTPLLRKPIRFTVDGLPVVLEAACVPLSGLRVRLDGDPSLDPRTFAISIDGSAGEQGPASSPEVPSRIVRSIMSLTCLAYSHAHSESVYWLPSDTRMVRVMASGLTFGFRADDAVLIPNGIVTKVFDVSR